LKKFQGGSICYDIFLPMGAFILAGGSKKEEQMKRSLPILYLIFGLTFLNCQKGNQELTNKNQNMISIVEIPTANFDRAVVFYEKLLDIKIEKMDMEGTRMGILPNQKNTVNVVLVKADDYIPSQKGTLVYLNAGDDLQVLLDKVELNGGKILTKKTAISPEMGFFAIFLDAEGNKIGLHSNN